MAELAKSAGTIGSCVTDTGPGFLLIRKTDGSVSKVTIEALKKRLQRLATPLGL